MIASSCFNELICLQSVCSDTMDNKITGYFKQLLGLYSATGKASWAPFTNMH